MELYFPVLYGTVREGRRSLVLARYVVQRLSKRPGVRAKLFDPAELPFGNLVQREWELPTPDPRVSAFVGEMASADGFVVVTPEYNYGIPGTLKNLLDSLFDEWNRKPFGVVTAGGIVGGVRAADQLRQVIAGVRAVMIPAHVPVPFVGKAFDDSGAPRNPEELDPRLDRMFDELEWYARALSAARQATPSP
ncbi:MAG: NAD(P)H-dependent oxidoreductase [Thermoplasmata archaeon]|nr:NAD(P)H-dependent oxidoreductase [Thermoplasmata archaeon]